MLKWKKYPVLDDGFVCLVDSMGDDSSVAQAARVSYGQDNREGSSADSNGLAAKDEALIRYLMRHKHTTPFEMVEFKFLVRVPMDCWRQWIRHRTASVNEYSTRYKEAIDSFQKTAPDAWRLQARNNKQGSSGTVTNWPEEAEVSYDEDNNATTLRFRDNSSPTELDYQGKQTPGSVLSQHESYLQYYANEIYKQRLLFGVAKEQARKDLPLSTYTEAYWKCDLHNIFHFLKLRLDPHAQQEIRQYAETIAKIIQQVVPVSYQAFEDYVLHSVTLSRKEARYIGYLLNNNGTGTDPKYESLELGERELKELREKLHHLSNQGAEFCLE